MELELVLLKGKYKMQNFDVQLDQCFHESIENYAVQFKVYLIIGNEQF